MKKITVNTIIALALGSMCLSSCIGSFSLTNNVLNWNKRATDNKFINELIFIVISPAYAVCSAADLLVLNTIEFWTGDKVIANVGKTQKVTGKGWQIVCHQDSEEWLRDYRPCWREVLLRVRQEEQELVLQQGWRHPRALQFQRGWQHPGLPA